MKFFLPRSGVHLIAILTAAVFGYRLAAAGANPLVCASLPVALWALLVSLSAAPSVSAGMFCISYPISNAKTLASSNADTAKAMEELWAKSIMLGEVKYWELQPFADNMMGDAKSQKAFVEVLDTQRVNGQAVNIPLASGLDGEVVTGDNIRSGNEIQFQVGNFQVLVAFSWIGAAFTEADRSQTALGPKFESMCRDGLTKVMAKKRADDILMCMRFAALTDKGASNRLLPNGRGSVDSLTSADMLSTALVEQINGTLPSLGAQPMNTNKDASGSFKPSYMVLANTFACRSFIHDPIYRGAVTNGDVRGDGNANFTGKLMQWDGAFIYRWINADHPNKGPLGNPLMARGVLALPFTFAAGTSVVQMGGNVYSSADTPIRLYAKYFKGSPYTFANGDTQALYVPSTGLTPTYYYLAIVNPDNSCGVFSYNAATGNNGATITLTAQQTITGATATSFVKGAKVYQCNAIGTYLCKTLGFGAEAVAGGVGSINGKKADDPGLRMANIRMDEEDSGRVIKYSVQTNWGVRPVERVDATYPNFVVLEHAYQPDNAPLLT